MTPEMKENIRKVVDRWKSWRRVAEFAQDHTGWGIGGEWGVTYPEDPEPVRAGLSNQQIPSGHVVVCGRWEPGNQFEYVVKEADYLGVLVGLLREHGLKKEARAIERIRASLVEQVCEGGRG